MTRFYGRYSRRRRSSPLARYLGRAFAPLGLAVLLGTSGALWLTEALIMPKSSHAYTSRLSLYLTLDPEEPHESLMRRAIIAARAGAQRSFDQDLLITEVSLTVMGENNRGITVPVLSLQVSRQQWSQRPDAEYWATYYPGSAALLQLPQPDESSTQL